MEGQELKNEMNSILIGKYLAGEAGPEEVVQLEDWIAASISNKLLFEQYVTTWNGLQANGGFQLQDKASAWKQLNTRLNEPVKISPVRRMFTRYSIAVVIAGVSILSIVFLLVLNSTKSSTPQNNISFTSVSEVVPNTLPDGSSFTLNSNSRLRFPQRFEPGHREVTLEGEGYFKIKPDPRQPFIIHFEGIQIQVLGTSFNVRKNIQEGTVETQVSSGKVKMFNAAGEIVITAGKTGIYKKRSNSFILQDTLDINSFSYATKNFVFSNEALDNIIKYLEKAYSRKIVLENNSLGRCKMTSSFDNKPLEYILDVIVTTLDITYKIKGDTIYIGGAGHEGC